MALTEKTMTVNGAAVHYWSAGEENGYPVMLVHGGIGDANLTWHAAIPLLADEYHIFAPDLPGFGDSTSLKQAGGIRALCDWLLAFIDALHIEQIVLISNSFGGLIVRAFAAYYPNRVPAVIISNGGILPNIPAFVSLVARIPLVGSILFNRIGKEACSSESLAKMIYVEGILTPEFVKTVAANAQNFGRLLRMTAAYPLPKTLAPKIPVLLLWGTEDRIATLDEANQIQQEIPGAKLAEITECGHAPQLEEPDVFAVQVKGFLRTIRNPRVGKLPGVGKLGG
jgi:pimeloyl-ACP methyl ester carboxylesterase